jgi:hypothetical protein
MQEGAQPDTWDMMACSRASENGVTSLTVQWRVHDSVVCSVDGRDEAVPRAATSLVAAFRRGLLVRWRGRPPPAGRRAAAAICWPCSFTLLCLLCRPAMQPRRWLLLLHLARSAWSTLGGGIQPPLFYWPVYSFFFNAGF